MATQGVFHVFNWAKLKLLTAPINLGTDSFAAVLTMAAQPLDPTFLGVSGDARYADLTAEVPTGGGYTKGGFALTGVALTRITTAALNDMVAWDCANLAWSFAGVTFKYVVIFDTTAPNHDLVALCDMDTDGGSVTPIGPFTLMINNIETLK